MKLKLKAVNGYNILVDENTKIEEGDYHCASDGWYIEKTSKEDLQIVNDKINGYTKLIFADPELGLDLPIIPNWEQWEMEKLANLHAVKSGCEHKKELSLISKAFIAGYNHNQARYTEEDLRKALKIVYTDWYTDIGHTENTEEEYYERIVQSLKKLPLYIVVETLDAGGEYTSELTDWYYNQPKLITLPDGKQTGVIKEVIRN